MSRILHDAFDAPSVSAAITGTSSAQTTSIVADVALPAGNVAVITGSASAQTTLISSIPHHIAPLSRRAYVRARRV